MTFWEIILWLVLGGVAGWLASLIVRGTGLGLIGDIIVGIIGGFLGGFIVRLFGGVGVTGFNFWSLIVAVIGAVVLLLIVRLFTGGMRRRTV
ncbi:MAG TPA: GlsB/YeaQ/YmgE family stress response membrane protein [Ktedonobacterales bacterium]